jgi:hypothetical protein
MIRCRLRHLEARCRQRGYTLDEVRPCIVTQDGDTITVDETHPAYPSVPKPGLSSETKISPNPQTPVSGVGTELKKLLSKIGIKATPNCSCNKRAALMDTNGIEWCEKNVDTIVGWLREEATKRKLPFIDMAGRILVKRAIGNAKKRI